MTDLTELMADYKDTSEELARVNDRISTLILQLRSIQDEIAELQNFREEALGAHHDARKALLEALNNLEEPIANA